MASEGECRRINPLLLFGEDMHTCVEALEIELRKIEAFKRELPLCMQLVTEAIQSVKEHIQQRQSAVSPILMLSTTSQQDEHKNNLREEDFMCSKTEDHKRESTPVAQEDSDKPSWMAQAQLWSCHTNKEAPKSNAVRPQAQHAVPSILLSSKQGTGGAFSPFVRAKSSEEQQISPVENQKSISSPENIHSISSTENIRSPREESKPVSSTEKASEARTSSEAASSSNNRKSRRCWSPELHKRFLNALQQLGGSHVATPKQIREIMKVDGLTNDEVKSHLQKYRLHTRRPAAPPQGVASEGAPQVVVLGWLPQNVQQNAQGIFDQGTYCTIPFSPEFYNKHTNASKQESSEEVKTNQTEVNESSQGTCLKLHKNEQDEEMGDGDVTETEDSKGETRTSDNTREDGAM